MKWKLRQSSWEWFLSCKNIDDTAGVLTSFVTDINMTFKGDLVRLLQGTAKKHQLSLISLLKGRGGRPGDLRLACFPFIGNWMKLKKRYEFILGNNSCSVNSPTKGKPSSPGPTKLQIIWFLSDKVWKKKTSTHTLQIEDNLQCRGRVFFSSRPYLKHRGGI